MMKTDVDQTKRLVSLHGWIAVISFILLYAVLLTGSVVVFRDEITNWSSGKLEKYSLFEKHLDHHLRRLSQKVPQDLHERVILQEGPKDLLRIYFGALKTNDQGRPEVIGRDFLVDLQSSEVKRDRTISLEQALTEPQPEKALHDFLTKLHIRLHIPGRLGLYLTGLLGVIMLVSTITGILIHRNIARDLFVAGRPGGRLVTFRDKHNLVAVWSLPFALLLSFTGAFLSFAISLGLPIVAMLAFGGNQAKVIETLLGPPLAAQNIQSSQSASIADLDRMVVRSIQMAKSHVREISIQNYGDANSRIEIEHDLASDALLRRIFEFDGASGQFLREKPMIGQTASTGSILAQLMPPLHYGNFAGKTSRIIWAALGAAMTYVTISGMRLWLRRREDEKQWQLLSLAVTTVLWTLPLALVAACYGFFLSNLTSDPLMWTSRAFIFALCTSLGVQAIAVAYERNLSSPTFAKLLATSLILLPLFRLQTGGLSWGEAMIYQSMDVIFVDALLLLGAVYLWLWSKYSFIGNERINSKF